MAGCRCYISFIVVAALLLTILSQVDASATLELLMVRFHNPSARDSGGSHCDPFHGDCDHYFRFALDRGDSNDNPYGGGHYALYTTGYFKNENTNEFGGDMAGVSNPIVTNFVEWPSIGVKFKVLVMDKDIVFGDDEIDGLVQLLRLTPALNASTAKWNTTIIYGIRRSYTTSLTIKYKLYCDANYYSSDCSVYCVANDTDAGGHYTCDPLTGNIICRPGWEDESTKCKTPSNECLNHACLNGATCIDGVQTYTCLCLPGYTGKLCSDVHESTNDILNATISPRKIVLPNSSHDEGNSSHTWLYVLIGAICLLLLAAIALIAFLCTRRRKSANDSENQSTQTSSASSSSLPTPPPQAAAAATAGFCVVTDSVDLQASNWLNHDIEKLAALKSQQDSNGRNVSNIYDSFDYSAPTTSPSSFPSSLSARPILLPSNPPEAAAAAAAGVYESIDNVACRPPCIYELERNTESSGDRASKC